MKKFVSLTILFFSVFFFACAGGRQLSGHEKFFAFGMKEINKGIKTYNQGCYKLSLNHFFMAHEIFTSSDMLKGVAMSLNNIGSVYRITGKSSDAVLFFNESFNIYMDIKDVEGAVQALSNKAAALIDNGMFKDAQDTLRKADKIAQEKGFALAALLKNKGILLFKKKEYIRSEKLMKKALDLTKPDDLIDIAAINFALGKLMLETDRHKKALEFFKKALEADKKSLFYKGIADDLSATALACEKLCDHKKALNYYIRSVKIYALLGDKKKVVGQIVILDKLSKKTDTDIKSTTYFLKQWLEGKALRSPCD